MQSLLHAIQRRNLIGAAVIAHLAAVAEQTEYRVGRNVRGQDAQRAPQSQSCLLYTSVSPIKVLVIVRILVVCQNLALGSGLQEGIVLLIIQGYQTPAVAFLIIRPIQLIGLAV